jgi:hypothetical protein
MTERAGTTHEQALALARQRVARRQALRELSRRPCAKRNEILGDDGEPHAVAESLFATLEPQPSIRSTPPTKTR